MASVVIPTSNLDLVLQTPEEALAWVESMDPVDRAEVSPDWLARVRATSPGDPWALSYTTIERGSRTTVGACAFKGPPDADGIVEIAYSIDPEQRGRGFATEAAEGLTRFAFASGLVRVVRAHCKSDNPASIRVLEKCAFRKIGEIVDPEDGPVLRWEKHQTERESIF